MNKISHPALGALALAAAAMASGCAYDPPMRQSVIYRLPPEQTARLDTAPQLSEAEKHRMTEQNQQILTEQQNAIRQEEAARTVVVEPYPYPWYPVYSPYYAPYYPFYPGLSLSLGYVWHGGGHHHGDWGGRRGGGHGRR